MKLAWLLASWLSTEVDVEINGLQQDSRKIQEGDLFLAMPGALSDGRQFIEQAIQAGASAIVYDPKEYVLSYAGPVPCIAFPGLAEHLGQLASRFYADPSSALTVIGVTGTNGKTTIAYQLAQAYTLLDQPAAYIGTLGFGLTQALQPLRNTTPDALTLQKLLHDMQTSGIQVVCMEVSSHALDQGRVDGITFKQAIFTNLTHDHLDYHHTMHAYAEAKAKLFSMPGLCSVIVNGDDEAATLMLAGVSEHTDCVTYGLHAAALAVRASQIQMDITGSHFSVSSPWGEFNLHTRSLGEFNLYNSLAVWSALVAAGVDKVRAQETMPQLLASPGRMEIVHHAPSVLVDYAHTPDALDNVLRTLTALPHARLLVVFGCGGDRDKTKRPLMGGIACRYADAVILTDDNPRTEDSGQIVLDIQAGITDASKVTVCLDRTHAIHQALHSAGSNDIVLIAGKGHESYQEIGRERFAFSDQAVVKDFFD